MKSIGKMCLNRLKIQCCYLILVTVVLCCMIWTYWSYYDRFDAHYRKSFFYGLQIKSRSGSNFSNKKESNTGPNIISYSLYSSDPRYTNGALANAILCKEIYPTWIMRVYYEDTVPTSILNKLKAENVELLDMTGSKIYKLAWRFQAAADAKRFCSRNIDSRLSWREKAAVDEWIQSGKMFHIMRDHPKHSNYSMLNGMWCSQTIPNMLELLNDDVNQAHLANKSFMDKVIWPMAQKSHTSGINNCKSHYEYDISGTSGQLFLGERKHIFAESLLEDSQLQILNTNSLPQCRHWGVVTTINGPTESIYKVAKQPEECLVIVADLKTPVDKYDVLEKSTNTVVFLSVEDQRLMQNLEIVADIPWNHFGRKNIGYLYAIMHGAVVIFDFDDDNELITEVPWIPAETWLVTYNVQVFNPYPTFIEMADVAWPRGFPLTQIQNTSTWKVRTKKINVLTDKIGVVQSLANHDPDMDAIWRLTRKLPMYFDDDIRVLLADGTFSSYNAQATVHYALWGMFLPISVHGRVSDIWRSYIMQRLMHDVGMSVGFVSPIVKQIRNPHNYQADYMSERPLYEKTESFIKVLFEWNSRSTSFEKRFLELFIELYERDFIGLKDVHLAQKWIRSLKQINYKFPEMLRNKGIKEKEVTLKSSDNRIEINKTQINPWISAQRNCYKQSNDWSSCAGDHLLYLPSTQDQLLSRQFMCLKEPFCWMQLDWRNTDPPKWSCHVKKSLRLYDMSFHDAVMANAATLIEKRLNKISSTNHEVFLCNYRNVDKIVTNNYNYPFKKCPSKVITKQVRDSGWETGYVVKDADFRHVDTLIFGFEASLWEKWMYYPKPLILAIWHVVDQCRCTKEASQQLFDHLRMLALNSSLHHVIGANTLYHLEYMRHYTGLDPIYLPATLIPAVDGLTWSQKRSEFLVNGHAMPPHHKKLKLVYPNHEGRYELSDLTKYAGVVVVPYSITNGKSVEQYAMNIPMFAPSVEFAKTMINDRTATYDPYCIDMTNEMHPFKHKDSPYEFDPNVRIDTNGQSVEKDVKFWISFAEIYRWPCIKYYDSWEHLFELLETADRQQMSACMKQANKWRGFEELQNWCWVTKYIEDNDI